MESDDKNTFSKFIQAEDFSDEKDVELSLMESEYVRALKLHKSK